MVVGAETLERVFADRGKRLSQTISIVTTDGTLGERGSVMDMLPEMAETTGARSSTRRRPRRPSRGSPGSARSERPLAGGGRGTHGMRAGSVPDMRRAGRPQGRERVRPPAIVRRRTGLQPRSRAVGSLALRRADDVAHAARGPAGGALVAGVKRSLAVDLRGHVLATPVMIAAGCAGTGRELSGLVELRKVGAIVSRTISLEPERGSPTPGSPSRRRGSCGRRDCRTGRRCLRLRGAAASRQVEHPCRGLDRRRHARGVRAVDRCTAGAARGLGDRGVPVGSRPRAPTSDARCTRRPGGRGRRCGRAHVDGACVREAADARVGPARGGPSRGACRGDGADDRWPARHSTCDRSDCDPASAA